MTACADSCINTFFESYRAHAIVFLAAAFKILVAVNVLWRLAYAQLNAIHVKQERDYCVISLLIITVDSWTQLYQCNGE